MLAENDEALAFTVKLLPAEKVLPLAGELIDTEGFIARLSRMFPVVGIPPPPPVTAQIREVQENLCPSGNYVHPRNRNITSSTETGTPKAHKMM